MLTCHDFKTAVRAGKYTSVGSYPVFLLMDDGEALCMDCAKSEAKEIIRAIVTDQRRSGWFPVAHDANWEDPDLYCGNCGERIESAYAEPADTEVSP